MRLVAFEGPIGVGKTSLANLCGFRLNVPRILEAYEKNPFLAAFYDKLARTGSATTSKALKTGLSEIAFQTELTFVLQHATKLASLPGPAIADFTLAKDIVYARMNLKGEELRIFEATYELLRGRLQPPNLVVLLEASDDVVRDRLLQRGREPELHVDFGYMRRYGKALQRHFEKEETNFEVVSTDDLHFAKENPTMRKVTRLVKRGLAR